MQDAVDVELPTLAELIRELDWASTPIGPMERWPQSLRTALSICLESRFPILIWWGPELVMLYNGPYAELLGNKHPAALGRRGADCFPEIWDLIGPMLAGVRERGEATWSPDQLVELDRNGFVEECYFTFGFSAIRDESGGIGGIFTAVADTTNHVIGGRRLRTLRELAAATSGAHTPVEVCKRAADVFGGSVAISFSLAYLFDPDLAVARLAATSDVESDRAAIAPRLVDLTDSEKCHWPLAAIAADGEARLLDDVVERVGNGSGAGGLSPDERSYCLCGRELKRRLARSCSASTSAGPWTTTIWRS